MTDTMTSQNIDLSSCDTLYMELLVKPEILTSYIYEPTFGNAEIRLFLFAAQCFNTFPATKVTLITDGI
jgi:hypothetical protein